MKLESFVQGQWRAGRNLIEIRSAVTGDVVAEASSGGLDLRQTLAYGRETGGANLRRLSFHQRAELLKKLATYLGERKEQLYKLSFATGATRGDALIDVDGGIGTLLAYAGKGRRELPNAKFLLDGGVEPLSKAGNFAGRHIVTPLRGVALHINAFNFPCWGLLEKLAPALLAGMPVISKPATVTSYVAHALARLIAESQILPDGALQFLVGSTDDLFDHLTCQDVVSFTGSAATSQTLQRHPVIAREAVRFIAERDSLNAAILAPDAAPGTPEFDLFVKEVAKEMTVKAGQKCTAIRRALVPSAHLDAAIAALRTRLAAVTIGDPELESVRMGPLVGLDQRRDVLDHVATLRQEAELIAGDPNNFEVEGADARRGAFLPPLLLHCADPARATAVHEVEAFGPVCTLMAYGDLGEAIALTNRGGGSLVASVYTFDADTAAELVFGVGSFHGRLLIVDRDCAKEQTGHGSPMPQLLHGGPGRAGGGEELGGLRSLAHYMQRTALQGSPAMLSAITVSWSKGAPLIEAERHPFRYHFEDLAIGQSFQSKERVVTLQDIEHFAHFTGDTFYAHMDEEATKGHPFFPGRVAHGYLLLSFAAGLFVDPDPGPVLANYGLDSLRFIKPVLPGEAIKVRLTAKEKSPRNAQYGEVRWDVEITTGAGDTAATYELLTMNAMRAD
ncbi:oxepin-CoA hydrolase/3-oxo-5,6-dehydrosuberyl-CoA semialdehyde dehydrogenase [Rhodopseudomonas rhenobacensis]|uniref:Oxepin-CoA hydrolase/3-oxo-5,6-dehydrosuberyl-CoA semialdehyde dehydrogenase n=1 Tax=Rhodopseudomonas rhenobacensis TaxID=87461 RepID=A0A7W7Z772_9BRAD|nr:phenylacetic acid degradation bifunctional protein PaaZ [Rhodopseudomonas rhenobacensis]MBB5049300.1 oxepin-CoA hydrolase/3-oxo-5,6-dehydrosuberyl-CoA semialdehyde dehydrogenase [Rhodopseudomonas rhenobacensis]